jgi:hypothetical protein
MWINDWTVPSANSVDDNAIPADAFVYVESWVGTNENIKVIKSTGVYCENTNFEELDNISKAASSSPAITFEVRNSLDDSGWISTRDPLLDRTYGRVLYFELENNNYQDVIVTSGATWKYRDFAAKRVWFMDIPDVETIRELETDGVTLTERDGLYTQAVTLNLTGTTVDNNNTVILTYGIAKYTSAAYFESFGVWGSISATHEGEIEIAS